jgi:hypothetical protein
MAHGRVEVAALLFLATFWGLGRRLPKVPLKILPRFDRLSPLPMVLLLPVILARLCPGLGMIAKAIIRLVFPVRPD